MSSVITRRRSPLASLASWVLALVAIVPFLWLAILSFKTADDIFAGSTRLLFSPTLENYRGLLTSAFGWSFYNSVVTSVGSTLLSLLIGVPGAYALARMRHRDRQLISMVILISRMVPPIAFTIPYFLVYRHLQLLDTRTGLVIIYLTFNLSLVVWIMRGFFEGIPEALEEAAWIDGAGLWKAFVVIVLPLSWPALVTTAILCFLYSWNDFFFALILTRTDATTAPVQVVNFMNYEGWEWGKIAAGGTLIMAPVLVFSIAMRRFLVSGMTAGAVK